MRENVQGINRIESNISRRGPHLVSYHYVSKIFSFEGVELGIF